MTFDCIGCLVNDSHEMSSFISTLLYAYTPTCINVQHSLTGVCLQYPSILYAGYKKGLIRLHELHLLALPSSSFWGLSPYSISQVTDKPAYPQMQSENPIVHVFLYWKKEDSADAQADLDLHCSHYVVRLHNSRLRQKLLLFLNA